jgi:hypothetical protein
MKLLTVDARVLCPHGAAVQNRASQSFATVAGRALLIQPDPEGRDINGCTNRMPMQGLNPCTTTLPVQQGYSTFIRIAAKPVCLDTVWGLTNGTPPGTFRYTVADPGQAFVSGAA